MSFINIENAISDGDQKLLIFNQYNDEIYDGVVSDLNSNEYISKIRSGEVYFIGSKIDPETMKDYLLIRVKEKEDD